MPTTLQTAEANGEAGTNFCHDLARNSNHRNQQKSLPELQNPICCNDIILKICKKKPITSSNRQAITRMQQLQSGIA